MNEKWEDLGVALMVPVEKLREYRRLLARGQSPAPPRPVFGRAMRHRESRARAFLTTTGNLVVDVGRDDVEFVGEVPAGWTGD